MARQNALKQAAPKQPTQAAAPRAPVEEQREEPLASNLRPEISDADLRARIEESAYYRAQQRGFSPGFELDDWIAAEAEVMRRTGLHS